MIIRQALSDDASPLLELKLQYLENTKTLPLFKEEYPNDIDQEREMIERYQSEKNSLLLVATFEDKVIGNIDLTGSWRKKIQHTAMIGMGIHPKWQHQGIGTLLIKNAIDWAKENEVLKIIWLEVYKTNTSGIALYKKMKFLESGYIPNFFLEKGTYIDKITMFRKL